MTHCKILFTITTLLFSILHTSLNAQDNDQHSYIVLNRVDTLYGKVEYIRESYTGQDFYRKIRLVDAEGKRKKYKRKNVSAFMANNTIYESYCLNQTSKKIMLVNPRYDIDPKNGEQYFLRLVSKGSLSHYELEWFDEDNGTPRSLALLKKMEDQFFIRADQGILGLKRKVLSDYFASCPTLRERITQKEFKAVEELVDFYNENCIH